MAHKILTIIPARYDSTRFPGKPLADILGRPMIQRVVERALERVERAVVATDSPLIYEAVEAFGGEVVMTSPHHRSGTERCIEAFELIGKGEDIVLNLQGDEPFVLKEQIDTLLAAFDDTSIDIATLAEVLPPETTDDELRNPNMVKLVHDDLGRAMYFSRSPIPYLRGVTQGWCRHHRYYRHIGLYAFRSSILSQLKALPASSLEECESLEQLRWLQSGLRIGVRETTTATIGIDTPEDLERALDYIRTHGLYQ